jgi:predicted Zn-ribbon and HTH transcriptional regulator
MKVDLYDSRDNCINTIENVERVVACKDGRYLITSISKCKCCGHEDSYTTQVPSGYKIEVKTEMTSE